MNFRNSAWMRLKSKILSDCFGPGNYLSRIFDYNEGGPSVEFMPKPRYATNFDDPKPMVKPYRLFTANPRNHENPLVKSKGDLPSKSGQGYDFTSHFYLLVSFLVFFSHFPNNRVIRVPFLKFKQS